MKREDMLNMEYATTSLKLKHPSLCVIDMLINLYDVQFLGCRNCIFRDTSIDDDVSCFVNITDGKEGVLI